ncbi:MAG: hypothetical protein ACK58T_47210 [Phycisphaerae bacterium]
MTVSREVGTGLELRTQFDEEGHAQPGFKRSQKRTCMGGSCWRRSEPYEASKQFGLDYESWQFPSGAASWAGDYLTDKRCRPSYLDVAFDVCVDPSMTADRFIDLVRPFTKLAIGVQGENDVNTRYIGARSSDRRIKVYRKDLQPQKGLFFAKEFGPVLRVELTLKDDYAWQWWLAWKADKSRAFAAAAHTVRSMCGASIGSDFAQLPPLLKVDAQSEVAQQIFMFMRQNRTMLYALHACGIDLGTRISSQVRRGGKLQKHRAESLTDRVHQAKRHLVLAALDDLIAAHLQDAAPDL